jgi:hypothetical protein
MPAGERIVAVAMARRQACRMIKAIAGTQAAGPSRAGDRRSPPPAPPTLAFTRMQQRASDSDGDEKHKWA